MSLLSDYVRWTGNIECWTGNIELFNDMLGNVDAALGWIDNADLQGNGFTSYKARSTRGIEGDMFSGWGIRTLSSTEKRYNPLGYHKRIMQHPAFFVSRIYLTKLY